MPNETHACHRWAPCFTQPTLVQTQHSAKPSSLSVVVEMILQASPVEISLYLFNLLAPSA